VSSVINKIKQAAITVVGIDEDEIEIDTTWEDLGFDELDNVEFFMEIEEVFGIEILDKQAEDIHTIDALVDFLEVEHGIS